MPLIRELIHWYFKPTPLFMTVIVALLVFSSLGVAYSSHQTRNMYRDLQVLEKAHDDLEHEYEKLLLEQSAWADYTRLNKIAQEQLAMAPPTTDDMVVVR